MERLVLLISCILHSLSAVLVDIKWKRNAVDCPTVVAHVCGLYSTVGVHVQLGGMAHWLLEEQLRSSRDKQAQSLRAASELEMERRNILNAMRHREPERGGLGPCTPASLLNLKLC